MITSYLKANKTGKGNRKCQGQCLPAIKMYAYSIFGDMAWVGSPRLLYWFA